MTEAERVMREALEWIVDLDPTPRSSRLTVLDWGRALDEVQRVARQALDEVAS